MEELLAYAYLLGMDLIPEEIYADDPLSWGNVEQSREIYAEMLDYYEADSLTECL